MQYFSDKVVQVNGKLFTSCEKLNSADNKSNVVIMREVEKVSRTYEHPVTGPNTVVKYSLFRGSKRAFLDEVKWDSLSNVNTDGLKVEL